MDRTAGGTRLAPALPPARVRVRAGLRRPERAYDRLEEESIVTKMGNALFAPLPAAFLAIS